MSGLSPAVTKPLFWFFPLALAGTIALYQWHEQRLTATLTAQEVQLAQQTVQVEQLTAQRTELTAARDQLQQQLQQTQRTLQQQQAAAHTLQTDLEQRLTAREQEQQTALTQTRTTAQQQVAKLTSELQQVRNSYQQLQTRHDDAKETVLRLEENLARVQTAMTAAAVEHKERIVALERHLNERVTLAAVTPKDADVIRAARLAGVLTEDDPLHQTLTAARTALADLEQRHATLMSRCTELQQTAQTGKQRSPATATAQQVAELKQQLAQVPTAAQLATLQQQLQQAQAQMTYCDVTREVQMQQLTQLQVQVAQQEATVAAQYTAQQRLAQTAQQCTADLTQVRAELPPVQQRCVTLARQLQSAQQRRAALQQQVVALLMQQVVPVPAVAPVPPAVEPTRAVTDVVAASAPAALVTLDTPATIADVAPVQPAVEPTPAATDAVPSDSALETPAVPVTPDALATTDTAPAESVTAAVEPPPASDCQQSPAWAERFAARQTTHGWLLQSITAHLQFGTGAAVLLAPPPLQPLGEVLLTDPTLTVHIDGHTDGLGDPAANQQLSQARAEAVRTAVLALGVAAERVTATGFGAAQPVASNRTRAGRSRNRRVEVYVTVPGCQ